MGRGCVSVAKLSGHEVQEFEDGLKPMAECLEGARGIKTREEAEEGRRRGDGEKSGWQERGVEKV